MSSGETEGRTGDRRTSGHQRSSEQGPSGLMGLSLPGSGLLTWNSCGQGGYGVGAAAAAGGAVGVVLFDQVILVGAVAGLGALAHFLSGRITSDW